MVNIKDWYRRRMLGNIPLILEHFDEASGTFRGEEGKDSLYRHALRVLAWFYKHEPDNPYHGDARILDMIVRSGDYTTGPDGGDDEGGMGSEWVPYNLMETIEWLPEELGPERRARWLDAVSRQIEHSRLVSVYMSAAPNHRIWQAALCYRAGQLFGNETWRQAATFMARQICKVQTPDGYWDESRRNQGPSPNYHRTHLQALDLYYRFSGDEQVRESLGRAVEFAIRVAYPDGTPIVVFDSRQPYLAAFAAAMSANALSRTPLGRRLLRNQIARLDELGVTDAASPVGFAVNWYLFATTDFMLDCYRFCQDGDDQPLPQEADGHRDSFTLTGPAPIGGGVVHRRDGWTLAISAAQTDLPRATNHIYNTERQSMFSVYHRDAGLIIGGGNRMRNHVPLANAQVLTGYGGVDCVGGRFPDEFVENHGLPIRPDGTSTEASDPVKACYYPIRRRAELTETGGSLHLDFLHAIIRFDLETTEAGGLAIRYAFEASGVRKLLLQVPIPLFYPGEFELDGGPFRVEDLEKVDTLPCRHIELSARGHGVEYTVQADEPSFFTWPLEPVKNWRLEGMNYLPDVRYQPLYTVGLLSVEFTTAQQSGSLATIEVT